VFSIVSSLEGSLIEWYGGSINTMLTHAYMSQLLSVNHGSNAIVGFRRTWQPCPAVISSPPIIEVILVKRYFRSAGGAAAIALVLRSRVCRLPMVFMKKP
jgi:hypothetical protein